MPSKTELAERICNQMLKGISGKMPDISPEQKTAYQERFKDLTNGIAQIIPYNQETVSPAFGAALCKCAILYGEDKVKQLMDRFLQGTFQGQRDPVKLLFIFMTKSKGLTSQQIYQKTVNAARAFCEGRTLRELRYAQSDIFEWNEDFSGPSLVKNKSGSSLKAKEWWLTAKPIYDNQGSFKIFVRQVGDAFFSWEYVIKRKAEILYVCGDQVVSVGRPKRKAEIELEEHTKPIS
jgi:hypothetical protein